MVRPLLLLHIIVVTLPLLPSSSPVQASEQFSPEVDVLERTLELSRHEKLAGVKANPDHEINEFTTDGCSGGLSVGWVYLAENIEALQAVHGSHPPWESCCISHDKTYHQAGTRDASADQSFSARKGADLELRSCVLEIGIQRTPDLRAEYGLSEDGIKLIYTTIADLMYRAVRLGGVPCSAMPWRWGYGWPECD